MKARVQSIDAIRSFRAAMLTFAEKANVALGEADSEVQRVMTWLENEQTQFWSHELRKRHEAVEKAKEALRFKQVFKSQTGARQSTVDEEKILAIAQRRFAEAEQKMANTKKWIRQLQKEAHLYQGSVQRLSTTVQVDLPTAAGKMERMILSLEEYVSLNAPGATTGDATGETIMSRGSATPQPIGGFELLRNKTPSPDLRRLAPPGDPTQFEWTAGTLAPGDPEKIEQLAMAGEAFDPNATLVFAIAASTARRIYLQRLAPAFGGDSGWYIGPADPTPPIAAQPSAKDPSIQPPSFEPGDLSAPVQQMIAARPDFASLLTLPPGMLIVIDSAGIVALLDAQDVDRWAVGSRR